MPRVDTRAFGVGTGGEFGGHDARFRHTEVATLFGKERVEWQGRSEAPDGENLSAIKING